jgi:hypothetical protein
VNWLLSLRNHTRLTTECDGDDTSPKLPPLATTGATRWFAMVSGGRTLLLRKCHRVSLFKSRPIESDRSTNRELKNQGRRDPKPSASIASPSSVDQMDFTKLLGFETHRNRNSSRCHTFRQSKSSGNRGKNHARCSTLADRHPNSDHHSALAVRRSSLARIKPSRPPRRLGSECDKRLRVTQG